MCASVYWATFPPTSASVTHDEIRENANRLLREDQDRRRDTLLARSHEHGEGNTQVSPVCVASSARWNSAKHKRSF